MQKPILVFDMDGVLVDVQQSYWEAVRRTVEMFTGNLIDTDVIAAWKAEGGWNDDWVLAQRLIQNYGMAVGYDEVGQVFQRLVLGDGDGGLMRLERWLVRPETFERLAECFSFAVFTGRPRDEAIHTLERNAPNVDFSLIVAANESEPKPSPDGLLLIRKKLNGSDLRYVGDTVDDARAARAAAVPFFGIVPENSPTREVLERAMRSEGAVRILRDVNSLPDSLDR